MRSYLLIFAILVCSIPAACQRATRRSSPSSVASTAQTSSTRQTSPNKRVILYSNGVAYIERRGAVIGHAEVDLS